MSDLFDIYIKRILSHEGGYSNDPDDPGNWTLGYKGGGELKGTKFGIAANTFPNVDIKRLTRFEAIELYRTYYWNKLPLSHLTDDMQFQMLDVSVNHGLGNAIRILQRALDVADDGKIGPVTKQALLYQDPHDVMLKFNAYRLKFYTKLSTFSKHGRGWTNRVANNLLYAAEDN